MQPISRNLSVNHLNFMKKRPSALRFGTETPLVSEKALKTAYQKGFKHTALGIGLITVASLISFSLIDLQVRSILKAEQKQTAKMVLENDGLRMDIGRVMK